MSGKSITFNDKKISKSNLYKNKKLFKINEIDFNKMLVYLKKNHIIKKLKQIFY